MSGFSNNHTNNDVDINRTPFHGMASLPSSAAISHIFWLMHGCGGTPASMMNVASEDLRRAFPHAAIYAPQGMNPSRNGNFQHFEIESYYNKAALYSSCDLLEESLQPIRRRMAHDVRMSAQKTNQQLDALLEHHHLTENKLVLIGYSQGGSCALQVALNRRQSAAKIISIFGSWFGDETSARFLSQPSVAIHASRHDHVVPYESFLRTYDLLQKNNVPTDFVTHNDLDHHQDWQSVLTKAVQAAIKEIAP